MTDKGDLFEDFPAISTEAWREKIIKDLKGKPYEDALIWKTIEGLNVNAFYRKEDVDQNKMAPGSFPYRRGIKTGSNDWEIRQDIHLDETLPSREKIKSANNHALAALMKGVTSVGFNIDGCINEKEQLESLLKDILPEHISLNLNCGEHAPAVVELLIKVIKGRKIPFPAVKGTVDHDPLGRLAITGDWYTDEITDWERAVSLATVTSEVLPGYRCINISGDYFHNAGASIVQEIAYSLAQGNEYLVQLTGRGMNIDDLSARLQFTFATGPHYFLEIAKLRAFRILWAKIVEQYAPAHECSHATFIHCTSSKWNLSVADPYNNILRATTEAMSAVIGGCNSLLIHPFDSGWKAPNDFSERLARNIQLVLKEESYMNKVIDPAGGTWYIEKLTDMIAEKSWNLFRETEAKGGFTEALKLGTIQSAIKSTAEKKRQAIREGNTVLVGVNKYRNEASKIEPEMLVPLRENIIPAKESIVEPLELFRASEEIEKSLS